MLQFYLFYTFNNSLEKTKDILIPYYILMLLSLILQGLLLTASLDIEVWRFYDSFFTISQQQADFKVTHSENNYLYLLNSFMFIQAVSYIAILIFTGYICFYLHGKINTTVIIGKPRQLFTNMIITNELNAGCITLNYYPSTLRSVNALWLTLITLFIFQWFSVLFINLNS